MFDTGAQLRKARKKSNLTLDQLAGKSGIDRGTISRIELGHVSPRIDTIDTLCKAMDTTLPQFFGNAQERTGVSGGYATGLKEVPEGDPAAPLRGSDARGESDAYWPVPASVWQSLVDVVERFEALLAHSNELVIVLDAVGRIIYLSPGGEHLLGTRRAEVLGSNVLDLIHTDDQPRFHAALTGDAPGAASSRNFRLRHRSGDWVAFACTLTDHLKSPSIRARILNAALA